MRIPSLILAAAPLALVACTIAVAPPGPAGPGGSPGPKGSATPGPAATASVRPGAASCTELFALLDRNQDGQLARAEYVDGMRAIDEARNPDIWMGSSCGERDVPALLGQGFDVTDADFDGTVTRTEFMTRCEAGPLEAGVPLPFLRPDACKARFAEKDVDRDGRWSREEFRDAWGFPNFPYGPIQPHSGLRYDLLCTPALPNLGSLFARFDVDGDSGIDEGEACGFLTGARPFPSPPPTPAPTK